MRLCGLAGALLCTGLCTVSAAKSPAPGADTHWVEANGVSLRYQFTGAGDSTVVLLHEIGMSLESWDELAPRIQPGRRLLRYDLRGFGQSEKIRGGSISLNDEVSDLKGLLDALNIRGPVTLVGGALGGSIALHFAATYPDRVRALVLISPIFRVGPMVRSALPTLPAAPVQGSDPASLIEAHGIRSYLDERQQEAVYPSSLRTDAARWQRFLGIELSGDPDSRAATLRMVTRDGDAGRDTLAVRCPTLVAATALFALGSPARIKADADAIPGAQFVVLQTGHLAALESPELVAPMLLQFFQHTGS